MTGKDLLEYRQRHGLKQSDIANFLSVDQASVSFWERDKVQPSGPAEKLLSVLLRLDCHPSNVVVINIASADVKFF